MSDTNTANWYAVKKIILLVLLFAGCSPRLGAQLVSRQRIAQGSIEVYTKQRDGFACLILIMVLDQSGGLFPGDKCAVLAPIPFSLSEEDAKFIRTIENARKEIDSWRKLEDHDTDRKGSPNASETIVDTFRSKTRARFCENHPGWFVQDLHRDPADDVLKPCVESK